MKRKISLIQLLSILILFTYGQQGLAESCSTVFNNGLQANTPNSTITFKCGAGIWNEPGSVLSVGNVINPGSNCLTTCSDGNCQASGQATPPLDMGAFQYNQGGQNIYVYQWQSRTLGNTGITNYSTINTDQGATLTFIAQPTTTVYKIKNLRLSQNSTVNFAPGDYWIENLHIDQGVTINTTGNSTVRLFLLNPTRFSQNTSTNLGYATSAADLFIYSYSNVAFDQGAWLKGVVYAVGNVTLSQNTRVFGSVNAQNISLDPGAYIWYSSIAISELDSQNVCGPTSPKVTHFVIQHDGNANYCLPEPITVSAYNGAALATNFTSTVKLDTGSGKGSWSLSSGHGQLVDTVANDGIAYYTFSNQDNGQAQFALLYVNGASPINISVQLQSNSNIKDNDSEGLLTFAPSGFLLTNAPLPDPVSTNITSYADPQIAGIATPIYITAYGATSNLSCGKITTYTGNKTIKFWQNYLNPTSGTLTTTVNNINVGNNSSQPIAINLTFNNGASSFNTLYRDVGMIKLSATDATTTNPTLTGSTNNYVVKPAKLAITNIPNNPQATTATDGIFIKAGDPFTVEVTAQDNNGNTTPNYGNEISPAGIKIMSSALIAPTGGINGSLNDGAIGNNTAFTKQSPGVFRATTLYFDEVGIIRLQAMVNSGNYLGAGNVTGPISANVGRFVPHHFATSANTPILNSACTSGGFTYIGQPFTYSIPPVISITAQSALNNTTKNYRDSFWKLIASNLLATYNSNSQIAPLNSTAANSAITVTQTNDGLGKIQLGDAGGIKFNKKSNVDIPKFNAEIQVSLNIQDLDGITYLNNPYTIGNIQPNTGIAFNNGNSMMQGRISLSNNFGSELLPLAIPLQAQYFNGADYVTNTIDNCTSITDTTNVILNPTPSDLVTNKTFGTFANGIGSINLSAPNKPGNVDITLDLSAAGANLPYLQYDWPQDGSDGVYNDNPMAIGSFGLYHGSDPIIYIREVLD